MHVPTKCQRYIELEELAQLLSRPTTVPDSDTMYHQLLQLTARLDEMSAESLQLRSDVRELKQVLEENTKLREQNKSQAKIIDELQTQLDQKHQQPKNGSQQQSQSGAQQSQQPILTPRKPTTIETAAPTTVEVRANAPKTYAQISSRYRPNRSTKRIASSARAFQETSGPQGYKYLYLPSRNRATRQTIRQKLPTLKVETNRVLDIHFPARNIVALLVHIQYYEELVQLLSDLTIKPAEFDPLSPENLSDPKFENLSHPDRCDRMTIIHNTRMIRTLEYLRPTLAPSVARYFVEQGWIAVEDIPKMNYKTAEHFQARDEDMASVISSEAL